MHARQVVKPNDVRLFPNGRISLLWATLVILPITVIALATNGTLSAVDFQAALRSSLSSLQVISPILGISVGVFSTIILRRRRLAKNVF